MKELKIQMVPTNTEKKRDRIHNILIELDPMTAPDPYRATTQVLGCIKDLIPLDSEEPGEIAQIIYDLVNESSKLSTGLYETIKRIFSAMDFRNLFYYDQFKSEYWNSVNIK